NSQRNSFQLVRSAVFDKHPERHIPVPSPQSQPCLSKTPTLHQKQLTILKTNFLFPFAPRTIRG
ncbi:MAG: hypothetical protein ACYSR4_10700, partial [Planctomycetota bacterium]